MDMLGPAVPPIDNRTEDAMMQRLNRMGKSISADGKLSPEKQKALRNACEEFESFFTYMLLKEMQKTVPQNTLINGGRGEEIFRDMMYEEMGKKIAHSPGGGIGIADMLYRQLSRQEIAKQTPPAAAVENRTKEEQ